MKTSLGQKDINYLLDAFKKIFLTKFDFEERITKLEEKLKNLPTKDNFFTAMDWIN